MLFTRLPEHGGIAKNDRFLSLKVNYHIKTAISLALILQDILLLFIHRRMATNTYTHIVVLYTKCQ